MDSMEARKSVRAKALTLGLAAIALMGGGCLSPSENTAPAGEEPAPITREQGMQTLEGMGFKRDGIEPVQDGFIVEGDIFIRLEDLAQPGPAAGPGPLAKTAQRSSSAVTSPNTIKFAIHSSMADWGIYVHQAVNNWNFLNTRVHIEVVTSGQNTTIYSDQDPACPESMRNQPNNIQGLGQLAYNGAVGTVICMNKDGSGSGDVKLRVAFITHEIGHTLGFAHSNDWDYPLIPGTPANDDHSIMNSSLLGGNQGYFTYDDMLAVERLYPSVKPLGGTDLDWDGKDDITAWRPSDGKWFYLTASSGYKGGFSLQWGQRGDMPMSDMEMNGDGRDDMVTWRPSDGYWRAKISNGTTRSIQWGQIGDIPLSNHDMDGDGKDDLVVWRWTEGKFYVLTSRSNYTQGGWYGWGQVGDIPVGGIDADRDGKDDWVVWRPTEGIFYVWYSANNFAGSSWFGWGQAGDIPVGSTDQDRDGKDDLTVWRPGNAYWYSLSSSGNFGWSQNFPLGARGDVPVIGTDIDQDGRRDIVIWRPRNLVGFDGIFFVKTSGSGFVTTLQYNWPPK